MNKRSVMCVALTALGCGGSESMGPFRGTVQVTATTTGVNLDPDGYMVSLDGGTAQPLSINGAMVTFTRVNDGSHLVTLSGVAPNCGVSGPNWQAVSMTAEDTVQ